MRRLKSSFLVCDWAREQSSLAVDRELPELDRARLDAHLAGCAGCRAFDGEVAATTQVLRDAPLEPVSFAIDLPRRRFVHVRALQAGAAAAAVMIVAGLSAVGGLNERATTQAPSAQLGKYATDRGDDLSRDHVPRVRSQRLGDRVAL